VARNNATRLNIIDFPTAQRTRLAIENAVAGG